MVTVDSTPLIYMSLFLSVLKTQCSVKSSTKTVYILWSPKDIDCVLELTSKRHFIADTQLPAAGTHHHQ